MNAPLENDGRSAALPQPYRATGFQMIREIEIDNFRCYRHLLLNGCKRVNLIVGDNGSGKTALLEAIFLALGSSTEIGARYRQLRGIDGNFNGTAARIQDSLWGDLFHENNFAKPIRISLSGDSTDSRTVTVSKGQQEGLLPFKDSEPAQRQAETIVFKWKDAAGKEREAVPTVAVGSAAHLPGTGEDLPNFFYFAANQTISSVENATRFSDLSKENMQKAFVSAITKEYPWIEDLNIEITGGMPAIFATLTAGHRKRALPNISGGINRIIAIYLAIASVPQSVILVDEMENGIFHKHHGAVWRTLLSFVRKNDVQLFVSTHSAEFLQSLADAGKKDSDDIALWRASRRKDGAHVIMQFDGRDLKAAIDSREEVR